MLGTSLFYLLITLTLSLQANTKIPIADYPAPDENGRLILLLHEEEGFGEKPTSKTVGATTQMALSAIGQEAGIIMMSPAIWYNIITRRTEFWKNVHADIPKRTTTRDIVDLFNDNKLTNYPFNLNMRYQHNFSRALYNYQLPLTQKRWRIYLHRASGLIILIPRWYETWRRKILTNSLTNQPESLTQHSWYTQLSLATGLQTGQLEPFYPPPFKRRKKTDAYNKLVKQLVETKKLTLEHLSDIFIPRTEIIPFQRITWDIYMNGHGRNRNHLFEEAVPCIAGIQKQLFYQLLDFFENIQNTHMFYYLTCYGGDEHLPVPGSSRLPGAGQYSFPIIAGALTDSEVFQGYFNPIIREDDQFVWEIYVDVHSFFYHLNKKTYPRLSLEEILRCITPIFSRVADAHGISNTPQLLVPGTDQFQPIDIRKKVNSSHKKNKTNKERIAHLTHVREIAYSASNKPYKVKRKRALLLTPAYIKTPLIIYPSHREFSIQDTAHLISPALVSLQPGVATHCIEQLTLKNLGLNTFLIHGFLDLYGQKNKKTFLIDRLEIANDLNSFERPDISRNFIIKKIYRFFDNLLKHKLTGDKTALLKNVILTVEKDHVHARFLCPMASGKYRAKEVKVSTGRLPFFFADDYKKTGDKENGHDIYEKDYEKAHAMRQEYEERKALFFSGKTIPLTLASSDTKKHKRAYTQLRARFLESQKHKEGIRSLRRFRL